MTLSHNIVEHRKRMRLTQKDLAEKLGVKPTTVSSWERGQNIPLANKLKDMADLFSVSVSELMDDNNAKELRFSPLEALKHTYSADGKPVPEEDLETLARIIETTIRSKNDKD